MKRYSLLFSIWSLALIISCSKEDPSPIGPEPEPTPIVQENVIVLNEGNWQSDNGQLSLIQNGQITNKWFQKINGYKLGDTPQDIIQLNDGLIAISINWSNIIRYIRPDGSEVARTENVPNCRSLCKDGASKYLYVTSYAHETALGETYTKGYVAKIDISTYRVVATCEVGYEPEGIAWYDGKLFVANTGGYAYSESHDYEHTVSVIDASSMKLIKNVEIVREDGSFVSNLYGEMSQSGKWLCINSAGNYSSEAPATVVFDCADLNYRVLDVPATYNTPIIGDKFFVVGSSFSYETYETEFFVYTLNPEDCSIEDCYCLPDGTENYSVIDKILSMQSPYCVYQNPYSGHLYVSDAGSYATAGTIYEYGTDGTELSEMTAYINPGHMLALPYVE